MPAKGSIAKSLVLQQIASIFKEDCLGEEGGKLYIRAKENGEWVKLAVSLTCCRDTGPALPEEPSAFVPKLDDTFYENLLHNCGIPYKKGET